MMVEDGKEHQHGTYEVDEMAIGIDYVLLKVL